MVQRRVLLPSRIVERPLPVGEIRRLAGSSMGTSWSVSFAADGLAASGLQAGMQRELDCVVQEMSHWEKDSALCCFNRAAAGSWHVLPEAFFMVLSYAVSVAHDSNGAYDPAAGALVDLWGFGPVNRHDQPGFALPAAQAVTAFLSGPRWRDLVLDASARRVLQPGGVQLDFSAVAKGYAVDRLAHCLERLGIGNYLVEVGGELRGAGMKPDGHPWWVTLEEPAAGDEAAAGASEYLLALHGLAVATSGDYLRCFHAGGRRYPHTLDPRSGYPIDNGVASATVIHHSCMAADALSTALTVLGPEQGLRFAQERGLAARLLLRRDGGYEERATPAFLEMLQ